MVRVHSGLPLISLNLLGTQRQILRDFRQLVTICHHSRKIFDCLPLMRGKWNRVDFERSRELGVTKLGLGILDRPSGSLQERCVRPTERVPAQPWSPNLLASGFQLPMQNIRVAVRRPSAFRKNQN
jgi:hypothetical protein